MTGPASPIAVAKAFTPAIVCSARAEAFKAAKACCKAKTVAAAPA